MKEFTRGDAWPSADWRSKARRSAWCAGAETPPRLTIVSPPVLSGAEASCSPLAASSTRTVPLPVPAPAGEKIEVLTTSEDQAVTMRPEAAAMGPELALPVGEKLTGACVSSILSRLGDEPGVKSRACQRIPWTVSRKLSTSLDEETVVGK